jgi:hypothetical protein
VQGHFHSKCEWVHGVFFSLVSATLQPASGAPSRTSCSMACRVFVSLHRCRWSREPIESRQAAWPGHSAQRHPPSGSLVESRILYGCGFMDSESPFRTMRGGSRTGQERVAHRWIRVVGPQLSEARRSLTPGGSSPRSAGATQPPEAGGRLPTWSSCPSCGVRGPVERSGCLERPPRTSHPRRAAPVAAGSRPSTACGSLRARRGEAFALVLLHGRTQPLHAIDVDLAPRLNAVQHRPRRFPAH